MHVWQWGFDRVDEPHLYKHRSTCWHARHVEHCNSWAVSSPNNEINFWQAGMLHCKAQQLQLDISVPALNAFHFARYADDAVLDLQPKTPMSNSTVHARDHCFADSRDCVGLGLGRPESAETTEPRASGQGPEPGRCVRKYVRYGITVRMQSKRSNAFDLAALRMYGSGA